MESKWHLRLSGMVFVAGAVLGLLISTGGLVALWANKANVTSRVTGAVSLFGSALSATHELIAVAGTTLDVAAADMDTVNKMANDVAGTLKDSSGLVSSTADLIGGSMVDLVNNTKTSLVSVENSAGAVDNVLKTISSVDIFGLVKGYNPDVPLQASVANVSRSLDPLPDALTKIGRDLDVSSANIATIQAEIEALAKQVGAIQTSLADARKVVDQYKQLLDDLQARYDVFAKRLPGTINTIYTVITILLAWIFISQAGMLIYGIYLLR